MKEMCLDIMGDVELEFSFLSTKRNSLINAYTKYVASEEHVKRAS